MLNIRRKVFYLVLILMTILFVACGGESDSDGAVNDDSIDQIATYQVDDIAQIIEVGVKTLEGNETKGQYITTTSVGDVTIDVLGAVLCLLNDLYIQPTTPIGNLTIYGCENNLSVAYNGVHDDVNITFDFIIPALYFDAETNSSITGVDDGYMTASASGTIIFALVTNNDGSYSLNHSIQPIVDLTIPDIEIGSPDANVLTAASLIKPFVLTNLEVEMTNTIQDYVNHLLQDSLADASFFF